MNIRAVYLVGSCARRECFTPRVLDYLLFVNKVPPGYVYLVSAPGSRSIVLPEPSLTCNKLLNPVTGRASSIYSSRIWSEPKIHVYGISVGLRKYIEYDEVDLKHYLLYLWIMLRTGKRKYMRKHACKTLYETLWLKYFVEHRDVLEYSWHNIVKSFKDNDLVDYCFNILLRGHRPRGNTYYYILNYSEQELDNISREYLGEKLKEAVWDIDFFRQTSPRISEGAKVC